MTERKPDHEGNVVGGSNANHILDTREYEVKVEDGDVTELTTNVIDESMYAMCDENGDHILLFDAIVDHEKNDKDMTRAEQKFVDSRGKQQYKLLKKFGRFVLDGRMDPLLGKSSLISKSATLCRPPNMPRQMTSTLNLPSTIGLPTH